MQYKNKKYKVVIAQSGKLDVKEKKKFILEQFKYREYAENFSKKIKKAVLALDTLPTGYNKTGFSYRGYDIYLKPCGSYLLFYTVNEETETVTVLRVMQDGMDWQYIINRWLKENA
jgi:plasmid stabilization system protein ParE